MIDSHQLGGQNILVTGASGFIGPHLCRRLCAGGANVHAVSRAVQPVNQGSVHWWRIDLTEISKMHNLLNTIKPDVIYHLAGYAAGGRELNLVLSTFHSNLTTSVNLFTVATEIGCPRIILPGSLEEPHTDNIEAIPSSPYAASKWASSSYARMFHKLYKTPIVILRVFMTYGPGKQNPRKLIPYVITSLLRGQTPKLSSGQRQIDWIYIDDVVDGMIAAANAPDVEGCTLDLGSGVLVSIRTVVQQLVNMIGSSSKPMFGAELDRPMEQVRVADIADTYAKIGWKPMTSLEKGLEYTVDWYRGLSDQDKGTGSLTQ